MKDHRGCSLCGEDSENILVRECDSNTCHLGRKAKWKLVGMGSFASVFSKSSQEEVLWVVEEGGYKQV